MSPKTKFFSGEYFFLMLVSQVAFFVFVPLGAGNVGPVLLNALYYASLLLGVLGARIGRRALATCAAAALLCFAAPWFLPDHWAWDLAFMATFIVFEVYVIAQILLYVGRAEHADREMIFAAVGAYFLVGMLFATLYIQVEKIMPNSYLIAGEVVEATRGLPFSRLSSFMYFSLVTLTTLGYGDIAPVNPLARNLVVLESFFGQVYMAILVARIVGLYRGRGTGVPSGSEAGNS
jgi:voltage-gated potassium channel